MTPKLTDEMRTLLQQQPGQPVIVEDDQSQARYVLLPLDTYQKIRALVGDEPFDVRETYEAQEQVVSSVWDVTELEAYNNYNIAHS